jgi:RimJ/RimL family protein N-acetyltransferase
MKIVGENIYLRELEETDATQEYCNWLNDPIVNQYLETRTCTKEDLKKYIREKNENPNCLFWGIFMKQTDKHIGNVKLEPIDYHKKNAVFGILIGRRNYWNLGIGTEVTKLVFSHAFNVLGLDSVELGVIVNNKAAIRVYEKAGMKTTETIKDGVKHGDKSFNKVVMKIWRQKKK